MSAHGIGPAWMVDSDGLPDFFLRGLLALNVTCTLNQTPDISQLITAISAGCSLKVDENDIQGNMTLTLVCFVEVV